MLVEIVSGVVVAGTGGTVGLLWRLTSLVAKQNGTLGEVSKTLAQHVADDRADFREVFGMLAGRREG